MSLINDLNSMHGKKKYQKININLGIETFNVLIPADQYQVFEEKLVSCINSPIKMTSKTLTLLINEFSGLIEDK